MLRKILKKCKLVRKTSAESKTNPKIDTSIPLPSIGASTVTSHQNMNQGTRNSEANNEAIMPTMLSSETNNEAIMPTMLSISSKTTKELRVELTKRGLSSTGRKNELRQRLLHYTPKIQSETSKSIYASPFMEFVKQLSITDLSEELLKRGLETNGTLSEKQLRLTNAVSKPPVPPSVRNQNYLKLKEVDTNYTTTSGVNDTCSRRRQRKSLRLPDKEIDQGLATVSFELDLTIRSNFEESREFTIYNGKKVTSILGWRKRRVGIWRRAFPKLFNTNKASQRILSVEVHYENSTPLGISLGEFIVVEGMKSKNKKDIDIKPLWGTCSGSSMCKAGHRVSPSLLVEYRFASKSHVYRKKGLKSKRKHRRNNFGQEKGDSSTWRLSTVCLDALENMRSKAFSEWRHLLLQYANPSAGTSDTGARSMAFRSMLKQGLPSGLFGSKVFPEDIDIKIDDRRDTKECENSISIDNDSLSYPLPHYVEELRIWDPKRRQYTSLSPHITGVPQIPSLKNDKKEFVLATKAREKLWGKIVIWLKAKFGKLYIEEMLQLSGRLAGGEPLT